MDKIAVVILNWNGRKMLEKYLNSVVDNLTEGAVVYIADNASTDDSLDFLKNNYPEVKTILLEKNWGFAGGYNKALKQIEAKYYVLLNSDIEVTPHWLTPLVEFMDNNADVAACQPKLLSYNNRKAFEYAGAAGGFIDRLGYPYCRGRVFDTVEDDNGQYNTRKEIMWATGACLFIRAEDYWDCGGLDDRFFAHNEEIDLCWRLRIKGKKIFCLPESSVYHLGGGTLPKGNPMKTFLNFRNNLTMLYKNLPDDELASVMRWRWLLDYVAAFQTLVLNQNWGDFKAIFKARRAFKKWKGEFAGDRERIQKGRVLKRVPQRTDISIVWQYFARHKKLFSALPHQ